MPGGVFVKIHKSQGNAASMGGGSGEATSTATGTFQFNTLGQLRGDTRLVAIMGLVHNQFLIFQLSYAFIFLARNLKNPSYALANTQALESSEWSVFLKLQHASHGSRAGVFVVVIALILLLFFQQYTTFRLYTSTDQTNTRTASYRLARFWIPINNLLIIVTSIVIILLFVKDHLNLAMRLCISLSVRLASLAVVIRYVLELKKKEVPLVVPSEQIRARQQLSAILSPEQPCLQIFNKAPPPGTVPPPPPPNKPPSSSAMSTSPGDAGKVTWKAPPVPPE